MANKEDFTIDIGFNIVNDKETREQINKIMMERVVPIRAKFESIKSGTHAPLQKQVMQTAAELRQLQSMTPTQAVNKILGATPRPGSAARDIRENIIHAIQTQDKARQDYATLRDALQKMEVRAPSPIERLQDMARAQLQESVEKERIDKAALADRETRDMERLYAHLGAMEFRGPNALERVQNKIRSNTFANTEKEIVDRQREFERQQAEEDHQTKILELIAKNTGVFKKWNEVDKWLVQHEQRRIRQSLMPGEPLTEYQEKVLGTKFFDVSPSKLKGLVNIVTAAVTAGWTEATREAPMASRAMSMRGFDAAVERTLEFANVENPFVAMQKTGMFNDMLRMGEVGESQMAGFAMFGRRTYAQLRKNPNDMRSIQRAFAEDMMEAEQRGWTRQYAAQKIGMEFLLPTLGFSQEQLDEYEGWAESARYEQMRAQKAKETENLEKAAKESAKDLASENKEGAIAGAAVGGAAGATVGWLSAKGGAAAGASIGTSVGPWGTAAGAIIGGIVGAVGGWFVGAGVQDVVSGEDELPAPDNSINMSNTVNITMDESAMRELVNGGSYIQTFDTTATIDNVA